MRDIKKFFSVILAIVFMCVWFSGCATGSSNSGSDGHTYQVKFMSLVLTLEDEEIKTLPLTYIKDGEAGDWSELEFSCEDPTIATVSDEGKVTGVGAGITRIKAKISTVEASITIRVVMRERKVVISEKNIELYVGEGTQITAQAYVGKEIDTTAVITYESLNPTIATVSATGYVTAVAIGSATIKAKWGEYSDTMTVDVIEPIKIEPYVLNFTTSTLTLEEEEIKTLPLTYTNDGKAGDWSELEFSSENPTIATVSDEGKVTGVGAGTTRIKVKISTVEASISVCITMREKKVVISGQMIGLYVGEGAQITAQAYVGKEIDTTAVITYESLNPTIATVSATGYVTAVAIGSATIKAKWGEYSDTMTVDVITQATADQVNSFSENYINVYGRSYIENNKLNIDHTAGAVELGIIGTSLTVNLETSEVSWMRVYVDGNTTGERIKITTNTNQYVVVSGLSEGYHKIRMVKATEMRDATWDIVSFAADAFAAVPEKSNLRIEFVGDSITSGYGVLGMSGDIRTIDNSDATQTYAYLTAQNLGADYSTVAFHGICAKQFMWGNDINMDTLYHRWSLSNIEPYDGSFDPDVIVIYIGGNDAGYLGSNPAYAKQVVADYTEFIGNIRALNANAHIICLYGGMGRNAVISNAINSVVSTMTTNGDDKIVYNPIEILANHAGAANHPNVAANEKWANALSAYISTIVD